MWQVDKDGLFSKLDSIYEKKMARDLDSCHTPFSSLRNRKSKLVGFKEFFSVSTPSSHSDVYALLLDEDENLSVALCWAMEKLTKEVSKSGLPSWFQRQAMTQKQAWLVSC